MLDTIRTALPLTVQLTALGIVIALTTATVLGVTAAVFRDRWPDQVIRLVSLVGVAAPPFWVALLLIQWLAVGRGIFPTGGYVNPSEGVGPWFNALVLPAFSLALPVAAQMTRIIRTPWWRNWTRIT